MAGLGCCTGEGTFGRIGAGKSSFGGNNPSSQGGDEPTTECDPMAAILGILPFGSGEEWPVWMSGNGCSLISILMYNEREHGVKKQLIPGSAVSGRPLRKIYTAKNAKKLVKCMNKIWKGALSKGDIGFIGLPSNSPGWDSLSVCKTQLMEEEYGVAINPSGVKWDSATTMDPPFFWENWSTIPKTLCPPLCKGVNIVLGMHIWYRTYGVLKGTRGIVEVGEPFDSGSHHSALAQVKKCIIGKKVCFEVQDFAPQRVRKGIICVGPKGFFEPLDIDFAKDKAYSESPKVEWNNTPAILGPGKCAEKLFGGTPQDQRRWAEKIGSGLYGSFEGMGLCMEALPEKSYIKSSWMEDPKVKC